MSDLTGLPSAVDEKALLAMTAQHHARGVRASGAREAGGHLTKVYAIEAPGRARHVLDGAGTIADRAAARSADVLEGPVR
jgi:hypothetical protein